jgi:glutathione S-transferase
MYQGKTIHTASGAQSTATPPIPPLYHWLGADAECVTEEAMTESAAILIHLTNAHPQPGLAPPVGSTAHARFLQWMVYLSANLYEAVLRYYYAERYAASGAAAPAIKAQALKDYGAHLERVHGELSPYVLGDKLSAVDPYLHMLAAWYPEDEAPLAQRLPKLAQHAELLRRRPATLKAEHDHADD